MFGFVGSVFTYCHRILAASNFYSCGNCIIKHVESLLRKHRGGHNGSHALLCRLVKNRRNLQGCQFTLLSGITLDTTWKGGFSTTF